MGREAEHFVTSQRAAGAFLKAAQSLHDKEVCNQAIKTHQTQSDALLLLFLFLAGAACASQEQKKKKKTLQNHNSWAPTLRVLFHMYFM